MRGEIASCSRQISSGSRESQTGWEFLLRKACEMFFIVLSVRQAMV